MTELSVILPSLHQRLFYRALDSIRRAAGPELDYEVVAVTPWQPSGERVRWVMEGVPCGNVMAHAAGAEVAAGWAILAFSDDAVLLPGALRYAMAALNGARGHAISLTQLQGCIGTVFGRPYPAFPLIQRVMLDLIGGWYDVSYRSHFADCDLGLRLHDADLAAMPTPAPCVYFHPDRMGCPESPHKAEALAADMATFLARWGGHPFAAGWPTATLRDFNIDIPAAARCGLPWPTRRGEAMPREAVIAALDGVRVL